MLHLLEKTMKNLSLLIILTILFGADDKAPNHQSGCVICKEQYSLSARKTC
jgi:hypothetical protein